MVHDNYRVWYDEGVDPGTEWDENIASHIEECGYLIALLSEESLESSNCRDEINCARELEKPRLLVYIEDVPLQGGMRMRLSRLQAIHKYKYDSMDAFVQKLGETKGLKVCRSLSGNTVEVRGSDTDDSYVTDCPEADSSNSEDYKLVLKFQEKVHAFRRKVLGEKHRRTLASLSDLAYTYGEVGDYKRALELCEAVYALCCETAGEAARPAGR